MERRLAAVALLVACDGGLDAMTSPEGTVVGDESPLIAPPDNPPPPDDPPPPSSSDCFANFSYSENFITSVTGTDVFDPVVTTRVLYQERDEGNDGSIDITVTYDYDPNGWLVAKTTVEDGHGTLLETWTYDDAGRVQLYIEDQGADGIPEFMVDRAYDQYGGITWVSEDGDGDGFPEVVINWTRDPSGNALTQDIDSNGDGVLDFAWDFTYDGLGRRLTGLGDQDVDGIVDLIAMAIYTDPVLEIGMTNLDAGADGSINALLGFEHDALGRPLWEGTDGDANGTWELETFTTWHETLPLILSVEKFDTDSPEGPVYQKVTTTYDALGRRSSLLEELDINGAVTAALSSWSFQGSCP